ncbi:TPA: hypothetical protein ACLBIF_002052, partial [Neisseria meningitidis]
RPRQRRRRSQSRHRQQRNQHQAPAVNLPRRFICRLHKTPKYCPNHGEWPKNFVIPAQAGI